MDFRNISSWAIRNPIPPIVLFIALALGGIISFAGLEVNDKPDISFPLVIVNVAQPGAAPSELETQVTQKIESAARSVSGVTDISSTITDGNSRTVVTFDVGTPVDRALNDVRNAVQQVRSNLPDGILEPQIQRLSTSEIPIGFYAVESTGMTLEQLSWYVDNTVAKRLLQVSGMAAVDRAGGVSREIRVTLDSARMQALGISAAAVNAQLRAVNANATGGRLELAGAEQAVRVIGNAKTAYQLGQTQIALGGGRNVKLADIAEVRDFYGEQRSIALMNGRQVLSFSLKKAPGTSDVSVYDGAQKVMDDLQKENPQIKIKELYTTVNYTRHQYETSMFSMVEGALLAIVVVFFFLRDWRSTFISALAIPLSAIPTFWFMSLMGFSLNGMSLLALSLVSGVLVDDAIVEIENIVRHMRMGKSAFQASIDAADEIGLAVLATTMAIVAVFLPVGLMPGITGQFFKNFGLPVVFAVLMSLLVARLITPLIAAYFLKAHGVRSHGEGVWMDRYTSLLKWSLNNRWRTVIYGGGGALLLTVAITSQLKFTFQPTINTNYSQVNVSMVPGVTLAQTQAITEKVVSILRASPVVESVFANIDVGKASVYINLKKQRSMTSVNWQTQMTPQLLDVADAQVSFQSQSSGGPGGSGRDFGLTLSGDDAAQLNDVVQTITRQISEMRELRGVRVNGDLLRPEVSIKPRMDLAAQMGVTTSALSQAIRVATLGEIDQNAAKFSLSDRQIPIRVVIGKESRQSLSTIQNMPVPTSTGGSVPLHVIADVSLSAGPVQVQRYNQARYATITADRAPGVASSDVDKKVNALPLLQHLPTGISRVYAGEAKWIPDLIRNFAMAVIAGILMVFAVLVLLYQRLLVPFVNLGSLMLAPLGGVIALLVFGFPISLPVMIGTLMLLGIVAKNSILLVDFAIEEMRQGVPVFEAIVDSGHKRAQPIVMTSIAMVAGMVPTAFSLSGDGAWRQPMGIMVIGGIILSTFLTLVIVPASFSLAMEIEKWLAPRLSKRLLTFKEGDDLPVVQQPAE